MKVLSCGAGMQSTALALMACENAQKGTVHPAVPVYDAIVFCDLQCEPPWVYDQVDFLAARCEEYNIPFYILEANLYGDYMRNFGHGRCVSIPFWSLENGKKGKMRRHCTIDYKIAAIQKFFKYTLLGYKKYQRMRPEDIGAHEMHIGFSTEEQSRVFDSHNPLLVNKFPLTEMGLERKDTYSYILDEWGLDTKSSACIICPFHRNYFYKFIRKNYPATHQEIVAFDRMLCENQPMTKIRSELYLSRSLKRIEELTDEDCSDMEAFPYRDKQIWNGF